MADDDLQRRLEKLGAQLVTDIEAWEKRTRGERAKVLDQLSHTLEGTLGQALTKLAEEGARHGERVARRREAKRRRRELQAQRRPNAAFGVVFLVAAALCAVLGVLNPQLWWLVLVGLGLGLAGAGHLSRAAQQKQRLAEAHRDEAQGEGEGVGHEVDVLCDQLLRDLAASPEAVRTFVSEPEKTVASMRATLKSLDLRRQQLLQEDASGRLAALEQQKVALRERQAAASDPESRQRLGEALASLDSQAEALGHLQRVTERVDGEYTSLLVHLQELRTRVSVARSTSTTVQLEGLKASVHRLNEELGAISEAMEAVQRGEVAPVADVAGGSAVEQARERVSR